MRFNYEDDWLFPKEYIDLVDHYGDGVFNGFITLFSPYTEYLMANCFAQRADGIELAREWPEETENMPPHVNSYVNLYPWAATNDAVKFHWLWTDQSKGKYTIILQDPKMLEWEEYDTTIVDLLYRLLSNQLPSTFFDEEAFTKPSTFSPFSAQ